MLDWTVAAVCWCGWVSLSCPAASMGICLIPLLLLVTLRCDVHQLSRLQLCLQTCGANILRQCTAVRCHLQGIMPSWSGLPVAPASQQHTQHAISHSILASTQQLYRGPGHQPSHTTQAHAHTEVHVCLWVDVMVFK
jgi:hypothetical protein